MASSGNVILSLSGGGGGGYGGVCVGRLVTRAECQVVLNVIYLVQVVASG